MELPDGQHWAKKVLTSREVDNMPGGSAAADFLPGVKATRARGLENELRTMGLLRERPESPSHGPAVQSGSGIGSAYSLDNLHSG